MFHTNIKTSYVMRSIIDQAIYFKNNFTFRSDDLPFSPLMQTLESLHYNRKKNTINFKIISWFTLSAYHCAV